MSTCDSGDPPVSGGRGRALCGIRSPFWWYGGRDGAPRPGGDPDEYDPRPQRVVRLPDDIPNVLQRLEVDAEGQYLPGQVAPRANDDEEGALVHAHDPHDRGGDEGGGGRSHEQCDCRRETWVRGGPLGRNKPDPSEGCRCACCRPRAARCPRPRATPVRPRTPEETWRPRPPFWWWCHDMRSRRPVGDPSLYAVVLPRRAPPPAPPLACTFEVEHPGFYLPGQVAFGSLFRSPRPPRSAGHFIDVGLRACAGFKPAAQRYWRPQPEDCQDEYPVLSGLAEADGDGGAAASRGCSEHGASTDWTGDGNNGNNPLCSARPGGHPWHPALLPSLVCTSVAGASAAPPPRLLRHPEAHGGEPCGACSACCRRAADDT
ncbi:hypothetical protein ONE63_006177 [Megalurothrips usitatus]|uniref:Uncharacterized protein n=1 Tax=Megalurothrips usitatus TaxID=439358 RepID=A0AAV7XT77_9NEOP|nr:hypothetical protein ONE63_006177 [Megalurothrips usitatus]